MAFLDESFAMTFVAAVAKLFNFSLNIFVIVSPKSTGAYQGGLQCCNFYFIYARSHRSTYKQHSKISLKTSQAYISRDVSF